MPDIVANAISMTKPEKTAAEATVLEMLEDAGFRERLSEKQTNRYQPHDAEAANKDLEKRIAALEALL
jgi:hypothetical protein